MANPQGGGEALKPPAFTPAIRVEEVLSKHPKRSRWLTQIEVENDPKMNLQPGSIGFFYSRLRIGNQSNKKQMETTRRLEAKGVYRERGLKNPRRVWWLAFVGEGGTRPRFDTREQEHHFVEEDPAERAARKSAAGISADLGENGSSSAAGSTKQRVPPRPVSTRPKRHAKRQRFYDDTDDERPQHLSSKNIKKTAAVIDPATEAAAAAARDGDSGKDDAEPVSNEDNGSGNGSGSGRGNTGAGRRGAARPEARHAEENDQADEEKEEEAVQPEMEELASRGRGGRRGGGRSGYGWARSKKPRRQITITASRRAKCPDETIGGEDKDDEGDEVEDKEIEDKEIEDKEIEDKEIEDKEIEDKEIEDKEIEDKEIEDEAIEDKEIEDKAIEDKEIEDKEIEDKEIEEIEEIEEIMENVRGGVGGPCQEDEPNSDNWAQCDTCKKWRRLPDSVDPEKLPAKWFCSMNKYDPIRARCRAPQEDTTSSHHDEDEEQDQSRRRESRKADHQRRRQDVDDDDDEDEECVDEDEDRGGDYDDEGEDYDVRGGESFVPTEEEEEEEEEASEHDEEEEARDENLRRFTSAWARRIKGEEKAESRLATSMSTRGKRKAESIGDILWIRCQSCGKWRSLLRSMDPSAYVGPGLQFYCLMNTWHESLASCSAPQENHYTVSNLFPPRDLPSPSATATNYEEHDDVENEAFVRRGAGMDRGNEGVADRRESWGYGHHGGVGDVGVWGEAVGGRAGKRARIESPADSNHGCDVQLVRDYDYRGENGGEGGCGGQRFLRDESHL